MKAAELDWPLFWQAWSQQNPFDRERWLARWVFADDSVKLSMRPAATERMRDDSPQGSEDSLPVRIVAVQRVREKINERSRNAGGPIVARNCPSGAGDGLPPPGRLTQNCDT